MKVFSGAVSLTYTIVFWNATEAARSPATSSALLIGTTWGSGRLSASEGSARSSHCRRCAVGRVGCCEQQNHPDTLMLVLQVSRLLHTAGATATMTVCISAGTMRRPVERHSLAKETPLCQIPRKGLSDLCTGK